MPNPSEDRERLLRRSENRYRFIRSLYDATGGARNAFANMWELGEELGLSRPDTSDAVDYLQGEGLLRPMTLGGGISITHQGVREVEDSIERPSVPTEHFSVQVINNYHGPVTQQSGANSTATAGSVNHVSVSGSVIGALAAGTGAQASGAVNQSSLDAEAQHRAIISETQAALLRDQDALEAIDGKIFDALSQFLAAARRLRVDHGSRHVAEHAIKQAFDSVWVRHTADGMEARRLPRSLEVAQVMLRNPAMASVVRSLLEA